MCPCPHIAIILCALLCEKEKKIIILCAFWNLECAKRLKAHSQAIPGKQGSFQTLDSQNIFISFFICSRLNSQKEHHLLQQLQEISLLNSQILKTQVWSRAGFKYVFSNTNTKTSFQIFQIQIRIFKYKYVKILFKYKYKYSNTLYNYMIFHTIHQYQHQS